MSDEPHDDVSRVPNDSTPWWLRWPRIHTEDPRTPGHETRCKCRLGQVDDDGTITFRDP